jgi:hypothetical protein
MTIVASRQSRLRASVIATLSDGTEVEISWKAISLEGRDPGQPISREDLAKVLERRGALP